VSPRKIDKNVRQKLLLDAAATVFARRGYQAATMDEVARSAGVAKGTLYLSYPSKEAMFFAMFDAFAEEAMGTPFPTPVGSATEQISAILVEIGRRIDRESLIVPLTLEFWAAAGVETTRQRFAVRYGAMLDAFAGSMVAILQQGQARGEIRPALPLDAIVAGLLAMIDGLIVQAWVDSTLSLAATLDAALPTLLAGLRED
jgi:TetR/AcrR family fatty acid metabolism transcriptional regulator